MSATEIPQTDFEFADDIAMFVAYLDDQKSPLAASTALSTLLRTEPPVVFGLDRVVDVVFDWADARAARRGEKISDLLVSSLRHVIGAYRIRAIDNFRPKDFYPEFRRLIFERCPLGERAFLEIKLRELHVAERAQKDERPQVVEFGEAGQVTVAGHNTTYEAAVADFIGVVEREPDMSEERFVTTFFGLRRLLLEHPKVPAQMHMVRLPAAGVLAFNTGAVDRAGNLFDLATEALKRLELSPPREREIRSSIRSGSLDVTLFVECLNDPERQADLGPILRYFADLDAPALLAQLAGEKSPGRARLILNILALHGRSAMPLILEQLGAPGASPRRPDHTINLLAAVNRIGIGSGPERVAAARAVGPLFASPLAPVRAAAYETLRRIGGREVAPHAIGAIDGNRYGTGALEPTPELRTHVANAMALAVESGSADALTTLAEIAAGTRENGFKWGRPLQDLAIAALGARRTPLTRNGVLAIVGALSRYTARKLFSFTGGLSGADPLLCAGLASLISDSSEPEALEVLAHPAIAKLTARG